MPSNWYLKTTGEDVGPITFVDLVELVRSQQISEVDLVRPDWKTEWQRADSVVGLWRAARMTPAPETSIDTPATAAPQTCSVDETEATEVTEQPVHEPPWMQRLLYLLRSSKPAPPVRGAVAIHPSPVNPTGKELPCAVTTDPPLPVPNVELPDDSPSPEWSSTITAALERTDVASSRSGTAKPRSPGRVRRFFTPSGKPWVRIGFRLVLAIACATFAAYKIEILCKREVLRLDRRDFVFERQSANGVRAKTPRPVQSNIAAAASRRYFPGVGVCEGRTYFLLLAGFSVMTGGCAFGAARLLESTLVGWPESRSRSLA